MPNLSKISQYVPIQPGATEIVREKYPLLLDFLAAYYEWIEYDAEWQSLLPQVYGNVGPIHGILTLLEQRDIDKSFEGFIQYFEYEYLNGIPTTILADKRKLIKHIKDFNLARGSEKSFKLLFRILYDDSVIFYYPKIDIIKPSDGKWTTDTVIRTTTVNDTMQFIARQIVGATSGAVASVENVVQMMIGMDLVSEIYISGLTTDFTIGETLNITLPNNTVVHETVYGLATGITLANPGTGYQNDDIIGVSGSNKTAVLAVNVISGTQTGRVVQASFINYPQPATIKLATSASDADNTYNNMFITITDGAGAGQTKRITDYVGISRAALLDTDWLVLPDITSHYSISLGNIKTTKVKDFGIGYSTPISADFSLSGNGDGSGTITVGAVGRYAGRYVNTDSFLSARKFIQDSFFYQDFSYVLGVHETLVNYVDVVKNLLHPASLALFGSVIVDGTTLARKIPTISGTVTPTIFSGALPTSGLEAQYSMIEDLSDSELLFDVSGAYPTGLNATLGSIHAVDINDPSWVINDGVSFANTFINANIVPINNTEQTIIVVAKSNTLFNNSGIIGCIDNNNDSSTTGFQIYVNSNGSITFRSQKMNPTQNDLRVSYPASSINTSDHFFASLRYLNNTVVGNLNQLSPVIGSYGTNVDATTLVENSRGYYMGIGGYHPSLLSSSFPGMGLYGSTLPGIPGGYLLPISIMNGYFDGIISYAIIYNQFLTEQEISNAFQFLKNVMNGRGISLS